MIYNSVQLEIASPFFLAFSLRFLPLSCRGVDFFYAHETGAICMLFEWEKKCQFDRREWDRYAVFVQPFKVFKWCFGVEFYNAVLC